MLKFKSIFRSDSIAMKMLLMLCVFSFALTACAAPAASAPDEKKLTKIGVIHQFQSWEMYVIMQDAIEKLAEEEGVELVVADGNNDSGKQIQAIETMMNSGVQGIICVTIDGQSLEPYVEKLNEKGITFISLFTEVPSATVNIYVDEYQYGYEIGTLAGKWAQANFPGEKLQAALLRMHDYRPGIQRGEGMREAFAKEFPTGEIVSDQNTVDVETAMKATEAILQANPDVRIFMTDSDDTGAIGAYEVLKAKVKPEDYDKYCVIGADGTSQGIKYVKEGGMYRGDVDVLPAQLGVDAYNYIKDILAGKDVEAKQYVQFLPVDYETAVEKY
ncbi:MAG: sugar ABC transporter substrate-binding protein [Pelolinea sp.]|nr:sugar ABC transporter substrate-binding protein [Pelolinea sp.]